MSWRRNELSRVVDPVAWLPREESAFCYIRASTAISDKHLGLDEERWLVLERWRVEDFSEEEGQTKLKAVIPDEEFLVVFDEEHVFRISRSTFLAHWRDMFLPSRDDALMISPSGAWCLFYCHEDEFEFGRKKGPNQRITDNSGASPLRV
jgi:hypothetical protein